MPCTWYQVVENPHAITSTTGVIRRLLSEKYKKPTSREVLIVTLTCYYSSIKYQRIMYELCCSSHPWHVRSIPSISSLLRPMPTETRSSKKKIQTYFFQRTAENFLVPPLWGKIYIFFISPPTLQAAQFVFSGCKLSTR